MKKSHYFVLHRSVEGLEKCEVFSVQAHYGDASSSWSPHPLMLNSLTASLSAFPLAWQGLFWAPSPSPSHAHPSPYDEYEYSCGALQTDYGYMPGLCINQRCYSWWHEEEQPDVEAKLRWWYLFQDIFQLPWVTANIVEITSLFWGFKSLFLLGIIIC